jgi:hypothetical protein
MNRVMRLAGVIVVAAIAAVVVVAAVGVILAVVVGVARGVAESAPASPVQAICTHHV